MSHTGLVANVLGQVSCIRDPFCSHLDMKEAFDSWFLYSILLFLLLNLESNSSLIHPTHMEPGEKFKTGQGYIGITGNVIYW